MHTTRRRLLARSASRGRADEGSALIATVIIAAVLAVATTATVSSGTSNVGESGTLAGRTSARLAAESGVNAVYAAMEQAHSAAALPCGLSGSLATSASAVSYSASVSYVGASGCRAPSGVLGGSLEPSSAMITSTGSARGATVVMQATVSFDPPSPFAPFSGDALATPARVLLDSGATVGGGPVAADVLAGDGFECTNNVRVSGSIDSWATDAASNNLNSSCAVARDVVAAGSLQISNGVTIGGNLEAITGAIQMTGGTVDGSWYAPGGLSNYGGVPGTPWSGPAPTMPQQPSFPDLQASSLTPSAFSSSRWRVVSVPSPQYSCSSFFASSGPSPFSQTLAEGDGRALVIDAPSCSPTGVAGTYTLAQNTALIVGGFKTAPPADFLAAPGAGDLSLALIIPESASTDNCAMQVELTDATFGTNPGIAADAGLSTLIYAPGAVLLNTPSSMSGQIISGKYCASAMGPGSSSPHPGLDMTNTTLVAYSGAAAQWLASLPSGSSPGCFSHESSVPPSPAAGAVASLDSETLLRD